MKIIIFGARGDAGSRITKEALMRGHHVTAVMRNKNQISGLSLGEQYIIGNVLDDGSLGSLVKGHDLIISALRPADGQEELLVPLTKAVLNAARETEIRLITAGGAASLNLPDNSGHTVLTAPDFLPEAVVPIATACQAQYELFMKEQSTDWTYLCPPAMLAPGERTGRYRTGFDDLLMDENGNSAISMEDFAVAMLDEAERPQFRRRRFTVAY